MSKFNTDFEDIRSRAEYLSNSFFNIQLDSGDFGDFGLTYFNGDEERYDLSNFSLALFYADNAKYRSLISQVKEEYKCRILRSENFPDNLLVFEKLLNIIKRKSTVIPFVGAGFSVAAGCPSWSNSYV